MRGRQRSIYLYLVEHVRNSSFNLGFNNFVPDCLGLDCLSGSSLFFVFFIERFKLIPENILKPWRLIWAEKWPILILFDSFHEKIWDPKSVEKITCARLVSSSIFLGVQKFENIWMPGFEVNGKSPGSFVSALVYIPRFENFVGLERTAITEISRWWNRRLNDDWLSSLVIKMNI